MLLCQAGEVVVEDWAVVEGPLSTAQGCCVVCLNDEGKSFSLPIQLIGRLVYPFHNTKFSRYIRIKNKNGLENDNQKKSFSVWCEKLLMAFLVHMN